MTLPGANEPIIYRGRIAPSPTGLLHLGHARTFWVAQQRARARNGALVLRNEDLDTARCRSEFVAAMFEDLRWFGFDWAEGPDVGGPAGPYSQSERRAIYMAALDRLRAGGFVYPCVCSRKDVLAAAAAPHAGDEEPIYPGRCRLQFDPWVGCRESGQFTNDASSSPSLPEESKEERAGERRRQINDYANGGIGFLMISPLPVRASRGERGDVGAVTRAVTSDGNRINWRFRVPDGEAVAFIDGHFGRREFVAGRDFGDFVVWRHDDIPAYQLAVVADDRAMGITEVVRGADLLVSTARQLLLYRALGYEPPKFYHCPLMLDENGVRLAKRHDALSLRALRESGVSPEALREEGLVSANPPEALKTIDPHARRRRLIYRVIVGLGLATVAMVVLALIVASRDSVEWTAPMDLGQPPTGVFVRLRKKLGEIAGPMLQRFRRSRPMISLSSTVLTLPPNESDPLNLGFPLTTNAAGVRAWILSPQSFVKLKKFTGMNGSTALSHGPGLPVGDGRFTQVFAPAPRKAFPIPVGLTVNMIPRAAASSIKLAVEVVATEPGAMPPRQVAQIRTNLFASCRVSIPDKGAVVLDSGKARDPAGNVYWMIISPELLDAHGKPARR